jgi:formamidopyrimidine-DNA glycosylase
MPELPEVETVRKTLLKLVQGKEIRDIDVFYEKMIHTDIDKFTTSLIGNHIEHIDRYGKYLLFEIGDYILISHLRMEGKYFIKKLEEDRDKHEHVIFYFNDDTTMRYHDTRKFGTFDLVLKDQFEDFHPIQKLGPEPFFKEMTKEYLYKKLRTKTISIKSALLDQTIIAGLGNIYVNEVLFYTKLHPTTPSNEITKKQCQMIIDASVTVLQKAIDLGGTTIRSYTSSLGVTGRFQNDLFVHDRENETCKFCNTLIQKEKVGGRGTYYCPSCQKKKRKKNT